MKLNKSSQLLLVCVAGLLAAGLVTACGTTTTDFVYVASAKAAGPYNYGEIDVFEINSVSGFMRQIPTSPFPSGGRNPVAEAVSTDNLNLYVVNQDDNTIVQFAIGPDGKLYPQNTVNTPGIFPLAIAVNGSNLFVLDTYQPLPACSNADPCSGSVAVFPILPGSGTGSNATQGGAPGTPVVNGPLNYWPLNLPGVASTDIVLPTAVNALKSGSYLYVAAYDTTTGTGYIFGFAVGASGALAPVNGGVPLDMGVGVHPSAIASDSTSNFIYVTDSANGAVISYSVASGVPTRLGSSPTGNQPSAIVADPKYPYVYVVNALDGNVEAYSISSSGSLGFLGGSATPVTYTAGIQPVAVGIDPSTDHFLFTVNFLGSDVSDFDMDITTGTLVNAQRTPYTSNAQPTAVAAVPHKTS